MKKAFLALFLTSAIAYAGDPFKTLEPGEAVLMFGSPLGVVPETTPYTDKMLRVENYHYLVHPLAMRLDRSSREIAGENSADEQLPVYRISRYSLGSELPTPGQAVGGEE